MRRELADFIGARSEARCKKADGMDSRPLRGDTYPPIPGRATMPSLTIGLDIAKNVFQIHGVDRHGKTAVQRKLRRAEVLKFFAKLEPSLVGIEACHSSHFWARELMLAPM